MDAREREKQIAQAEEMLGDRLKGLGLAKALFYGQHRGDKLPPYPDLTADQAACDLAARLRTYCEQSIDPVAIDRQAAIAQSVIQGLGRLGVLGACLPTAVGGLGLGQTAYCQSLEVLGGHCAGTALFVNAHHSIGPRALVLFGRPDQQKRWLPKLATGEWLSAFALTEPEAGSDAANVQTQATPTADGAAFVLNGQKRWITNGGIAQVLTVMARTPVPGSRETKITAFLVTPDMPGFHVLEPRMEKCGVRGTATARLEFKDLRVPRENILGELGKGLRVALTVLDFGRTTFGASCTGAAKFCLARAAAHANARVQFGQTLGSFELVQEKLAYMAAGAYAMEATTYQTAALIDSGAEEYMLETAMLKVFATETLWQIVNDTIQVFGGKAYFTDEPYERMLRDARINQIGEGANDVLRVFIAAVGLRDVGLELQSILAAFDNPLKNFARLGTFAGRRLAALLASPEVRVRCPALQPQAEALGRLIGQFGAHVDKLLRQYQEEIVDRQFQLGRVANAAIELYASCCVLQRLDWTLHRSEGHAHGWGDELALGSYYLASAARRIRQQLAAAWDNDDTQAAKVAAAVLESAR